MRSGAGSFAARLIAVTAPDRSLNTIATPTMWFVTVAAVVALLVLDAANGQRPGARRGELRHRGD